MLKNLIRPFYLYFANLMFRVLRASPDYRASIGGLASGQLENAKLRLNAKGQPQLGMFWHEFKDLDLMKNNIKMLGLHQARGMYSQLRSVSSEGVSSARVTSSLCREEHFYTPWFKYWCDQLKLEPIFHRKVWEYAFVLQALSQANMLTPGRRAIGFGCGEEPMASYLASIGIEVVVTDLPPDMSANLGWMETGQHTGSLDKAYYPDLVEREEFDRLVRLEYVDMNKIPDAYTGQFDFCWSICAMEHLGSLAKGSFFVKDSMKVLRDGGVSVHTTEYNINGGPTIDNWQTVLFQEQHINALADDLKRAGHSMLPFDSDPGSAFLDGYFDLPPYASSENEILWPAHLKLSVDGFSATCVGVIVNK